MSFSKLLTWNFLDLAKAKFPRSDLKILSYGPCQTPTLWFVVERHKEIQRFRRERWWEASFVFNGLTFTMEKLWTEPRSLRGQLAAPSS